MNFGQWLGFCSLVIALYILWQIHQLLLLIFSAVVLATALNRLVRQLLQRGIRQRSLAVLLTLGLVLIALVLFVGLIVPPFVAQFQKLLELLPAAFAQARAAIVELERFSDWIPEPPTWKDLSAQVQPLGTAFLQVFSSSVATLLQLLLVVVLTLMMLFNPQGYRQGFLKLFPSFYRARAEGILDRCEIALGSWLQGMVINCLFIGIGSGIGLWFFGVDLLLVHALIAGLLNFIPNIGPVTSAIFPIMVAVLDAPWKVVAVLIWYVVLQNLESYWLSPTVMAKQVNLLPAITLTAQIFFARSFGLLGLILALPLTVVAKTWLEELVFIDILDQWQDCPGWLRGAIAPRSVSPRAALTPASPTNSTASVQPDSLAH
ncbi:MAG: AI-2E family transporter [Cyanobacteria bacterium P01_G01_bin.54]